MRRTIIIMMLMFSASVIMAQDCSIYESDNYNTICCGTLQLDNGDMILIERKLNSNGYIIDLTKMQRLSPSFFVG